MLPIISMSVSGNDRPHEPDEGERSELDTKTQQCESTAAPGPVSLPTVPR